MINYLLTGDAVLFVIYFNPWCVVSSENSRYESIKLLSSILKTVNSPSVFIILRCIHTLLKIEVVQFTINDSMQPNGITRCWIKSDSVIFYRLVTIIPSLYCSPYNVTLSTTEYIYLIILIQRTAGIDGLNSSISI